MRAWATGAAARAAVGGQPLRLTGALEADIRHAAVFIQQVFENPPIPAILPEIVRGVLAQPPELDFHAIAPRRTDFGRIYQERARVEGFDPSIDPHLGFDILLGTAIAYLMANHRPMTEEAAGRLAEVIIAGMRATTGDEQTARPHQASGPNPRVVRGRRGPAPRR